MAFNIPTTQDTFDTDLANLESALNQDAPLAEKAFLRVLAAVLALNETSAYKYAAERAMQTLALTATGDDLANIGLEFGVVRKAAEAAVLTIQLPGQNGTFIPATVDFTGDSNGIRYIPNSSAVIAGGFATLDVTAAEAGVIGNLNNGNTMTIGTQVPGAETVATVTATVNTGAEQESEDAFRKRILFEIRTVSGGSNATDHKEWAEEVAGVQRAYPYSGKPFDEIEDSFPGERTVYVQSTTAVDPDGVPPQGLLDEVRQSLLFDPITGDPRPALGLGDENLYVEPIERLSFVVRVIGLDVSQDIEAQVMADIETALTNYFFNLFPFIVGIDFPPDRNDTITDPSVSDVVQDVVAANSGSVEGVQFGFDLNNLLTIYTLNPGELAKLDSVTYA